MLSPSSESPPSTTRNHGFAKLTWEIENFSTLSDHKSPKFYFPENNKVQFILECSPNEDQFVEFNLYLCPISQFDRQYLLVEPYDSPNVSFRMAILGTNGPWYFSQEYHFNYFPFVFPDSNHEIGGHEMKRDYLLDPANGLLINDKLTVYCEVQDNCLKKSLTIPANPIRDDFRSLLESGKFSDAVFLIEGKCLSVHKNILTASSDVFAAMFEHNFVEKNTNRVQITDVEVEVFKLMLDFIYTGQIPNLGDYASELFVAADKYQLNILRKSCKDYLMDNLTSNTVASILIIADMHRASDLKEACSNYISNNVKHVKQTEGWKVLLTKPDLMEELYSKMADEKDILKEKVKSLKYDIKVLKKRAPPGIWPKASIKSNLKLSCKVVEDFSTMKNSYKANIESLLDNGNFSDAFLVVGDEQLSVHRNIISARSNVFAELFKSEQTSVRVDDIPVEACKVLLRYIYTGKVGSNLTEFAHHLLEAAQKHQLCHLKVICEKSLITSITVESVVDKFVLAHTNEANFLKRSCSDFISENIKQVIQTDGWKTLKQARPEFACELFEQFVEKKL